ncbi:MAG: DUF2804 domain-containing protein [Deltaproteobacteria bacterium]|nr:DUF2804 domain-containing protein [Deltaproteobacteria bacterium]
MTQHEITAPGPLLGPDGRLREAGYARRALLDYNPDHLRVLPGRALTRLRLKEWDYYGVTTDDFFFSAAVSHAGYAGVIFAYLIDFREGVQYEDTLVTPLGAGCALPRTARAGDVVFSRGGVKMEFAREPNRRTLRVGWPSFAKGRGLAAEWSIDCADDDDSIVMATPIAPRHFYYNEKIPAMPARGYAVLGGRRYASDAGLATLDWGRGAWPYRTYWNWASASGRLGDGRRFGLNLGEGFGDLSKATENCFFLDGRMTKLASVPFDYTSGDFMKPWRFRDDAGRFELTMTPIFDRVTITNLVILSSGVHQVFGRYEGFVVTDAGERVAIRDVIGWAEEHHARW